METLGPEQQRAIEEPKLLRQIEYAWRASAFYRRKWRAAGIDPRQIHCADALVTLPYTEKDELQETQEANPPFGANQCVPLDQAIRMHGGQATPSAQRYAQLSARERSQLEAFLLSLAAPR